MLENNFVVMLNTLQLDERDIEVVMKYVGVNKQQATKALANNKNHRVNAIMELMELNG